jgi:hypothetical protein
MVRVLAVYRGVAGVGIWVAPRITSRIFGFNTRGEDTPPYLGRLAGAREAAFALGPLLATGEARRLWLRLGFACDVLDTVAAGAGLRGGYFTGRQAAGTAAATGISMLLTAAVLAGEGGP